MTKSLILICVWAAVAALTYPQSLYNNAIPAGLTGEGFRTRSRPQGGDYSEVQPGNGSIATSFRQWTYLIADDFLVSDFWRVNRVTVWGFQPFLHFPSVDTGILEIRSGSFVGPTVAVGAFQRSEMTDIFRIFNNQPNDNDQVQKITYQINAYLPPGHYWLCFNAFGVPNFDGPQSPFLTKVGSQTTPGANAKVRVSAWTFEWYDIYDAYTLLPQDIPFWIDGYRLASLPGTKR